MFWNQFHFEGIYLGVSYSSVLAHFWLIFGFDYAQFLLSFCSIFAQFLLNFGSILAVFNPIHSKSFQNIPFFFTFFAPFSLFGCSKYLHWLAWTTFNAAHFRSHQVLTAFLPNLHIKKQIFFSRHLSLTQHFERFFFCRTLFNSSGNCAWLNSFISN